MTKQEAKLGIARTIRNAVINDKTDKLKVDRIKEVMQEKKITRTQLKATIRSGNASFKLIDDPDGSKTEAMKVKICEWIDNNFDKPTNYKGLRRC